jgi:uncharacterized membrane protein YphA (DoxX/SURF4 family)
VSLRLSLDWAEPKYGELMVTAARILLSFVFCTSGLGKLFHYRASIKIVQAYRLLPPEPSRLVGILLPWIELVLGIILFFGTTVLWSGLFAAALFLVFATALSVNLIRHTGQRNCGCFGFAEGRLAWKLVIRNIGFLILALLCSFASPGVIGRRLVSVFAVGISLVFVPLAAHLNQRRPSTGAPNPTIG